MKPPKELPLKTVLRQNNPSAAQLGAGVLLLVLGALCVWFGFHTHSHDRTTQVLVGFTIAFSAAGWIAIEILLTFAVYAVKRGFADRDTGGFPDDLL